MLTTTRCNGEFIPSSRVSPLTAVDLLVQFLDHRHRSSAHSILVPVPILLDVPILRSSSAPRPHTSSSRLRSAPSCRRRHRLPPCQYSLLPPLPPPPAAPFLCLISLSCPRRRSTLPHSQEAPSWASPHGRLCFCLRPPRRSLCHCPSPWRSRQRSGEGDDAVVGAASVGRTACA